MRRPALKLGRLTHPLWDPGQEGQVDQGIHLRIDDLLRMRPRGSINNY
jgi:hypothetical protein